MSLWAQYLRESGLLEIFEREWGFITFHLAGDGVLFVNDIYVTPAYRKYGKASSLIDEAAEWGRTYGCNRIYCFIHGHSESKETARRAALAYGFEVKNETPDAIVLEKSI